MIKDGIYKIDEREDFREVIDKAIKRTQRLGANYKLETIYLLEKEIDGYRSSIEYFQERMKEIEIMKKEELDQYANEKIEELKGTIESTKPEIEISLGDIYITNYPKGYLERMEKE